MWILQAVFMAVIQDPSFAAHKFPPSTQECYPVGVYEMQYAGKLEGNRIAVYQEDGLTKVGIIQVKSNGEHPEKAGLKWQGRKTSVDEYGVASITDYWEECLRD